MKLKQIEKIFIECGIEPNEAKIEAKMLVKHFCGLSDIDLVMNDEFAPNETLMEKIRLRTEKRFPIQHLIGTAYFMGEDFVVNENVLIPRDETEILVRKVVDIINKYGFESALDIGTGSGCIACMIAKLTKCKVLGVDISTAALQVAIDNSSKLGLFNKAIFRKSDIFSNIKEKFDLIVSNPPYIPIAEKENLQVEVKFEPDSALFAHDKKGVEFYDKIIEQSSDYLNNNGFLLFELGINQASVVMNKMMESGFKDIQSEKDLAGIERIVWGNK